MKRTVLSEMTSTHSEDSMKAELTSEMDGKYLTFFTDSQLFGVPIVDVVQIVAIQKITPIPEHPQYAKGIINLRGNIVPVIDVRIRFGKTESDYTDRTCIVVAMIDNTYFGFVVDSVDEVTSILDEQISPPPKLSGNNTSAYLTGIAKLNDKVILLIDTAKMLRGQEMKP